MDLFLKAVLITFGAAALVVVGAVVLMFVGAWYGWPIAGQIWNLLP